MRRQMVTVRGRFVAAVSVTAVMAMALACGVDASSLPAVTPEEEDWLSSCRHAGFDPYQLACSTCDMLPPLSSPSSSLSDACLRCCQPYKDVERIRKPYEAAVLIIHHHKSGGSVSGGGGNKGEFDQFLDDDFDTLVQAKGEHRLGKLLDPHLDRFPSLLSNGGGFYFHLPVATLLFFDSMDAVAKHQQHGRKDKGSDDALLDAAKEVIKLDGWKRDDIRDMLTALLP
jgi:hypothetical protein